MMRGTFNPDKVVDFGDGHVSLTAQQQMAFVEQMRHAELTDFNAAIKIKNYKPKRNPLLAEETARSQKAKVLVRKMPPKRTLIGGNFVLMEDMCTARRTDVKQRTKKREQEDAKDKQEYEQFKAQAKKEFEETRRESAVGNNQGESARLSTARSRLEAVQRSVRGENSQPQFSPSVSNRSFGRTPRPQTAGARSSRSTARSDYNSYRGQPEVEEEYGNSNNGLVESYFEQARDTARDTGRQSQRSSRSVRPQSAAPRSQRSERSDVRVEETRNERKARPSTSRPIKNKKMARSSTLKKLALTKPHYAAAMRAERAEQYLDERERKRAEATKAHVARPEVKPKKNNRPSTAPSSRKPPKNPAEVGIPDGGNYKSTTAYKYNEYGASQLPAPWATHYHVFEKFPEPVLSERSQKERMLQTKMMEIQAQLKAVEDELEERRRERISVESKTNNKTRKAVGLPPHKKKMMVGSKKVSKKAPSNTVTISKSARAFIDKL
ncbi:hypothetical protein TrLO_g5981 [Triparma laevis f. longispina]|uniref:Uncharacterized protein n=1 Tax=Triparma laevis f. longispina TaxID=1714387 RepID=A0A9W7F292_9STRA|nr:hypothetical protein TrLO_g5981 [Triparma laevis f. longispina]